MTKIIYDLLYDGNVLLYLIILLAALGLTIAALVGWWKIYVKMGLSGWLSLVPFYGYYVFCKKLGCKRAYWINLVLSLVLFAMEILVNDDSLPYDFTVFLAILYLLLSIVSFFVTFKIMTRLSDSFGHGVGFAFGLSLLTIIFVIILGFDNSEYYGNSVD